MPFFGQTLSDFGQKVGGILDPQAPTYLGNMTGNPMFQAGMGILSANQDPDQNVFQGAMRGLTAAKQQSMKDEDRKRNEQLREALAKLLGQQPGAQGMPGTIPGLPGAPGTPPGGTPGIIPPPPGPSSYGAASRQSQFPGAQPRDPITEQMMQRMFWSDITGANYG